MSLNQLIDRSLSSRTPLSFLDLGSAIEKTSISPFLSRHSESARKIAEGIEELNVPQLSFLRLSEAEKTKVRHSFSNNIVLMNQLLKREDRLPRRRYANQFISPLFQEFPDKGLFKCCIYAMFRLRAEYPDSAYAAQIGQSYLEFAYFAYGVYFETEGRIPSLRLFENLLDGFDEYGVEFTDGIKLYQLQTFIEKTAKGENPFYLSERTSFENLFQYSEDDFRCIPAERIFPMVEFDPEDWKAAKIPLSYSKEEANRFRLVCEEFISSRDEVDPFVSEREIYRFQNVSCAKSDNPKEGAKLRNEVRSGYEMDDEPFQFKRTLINVSTSNYRDAWVNTPQARKKLAYFEILTRRMIRNLPEIPDGDMENDGYVNHLRETPNRTYVMGDLKKWGITFPVYLIRIFCEEAEKRFPFGWIKLAEQLENATLWVKGEPVKIGTRGFGLGNLNYISSVIHYLILKMTNCEKFIVRSDDSLSVYRKSDNPHYEIYLKEKLGFIVNRKKVNISSHANVFCENYTEVEAKFKSQLYEKLGYMTGQIGQVMRKVCNASSCKYYTSVASLQPLPAKSLIDFLMAIGNMIFGPELDPTEFRLDAHNGGWSSKYYSTNLKTEYIAFEEDLDLFPSHHILIKKIYKNNLQAVAPSNHSKKSENLYKIFDTKIFPLAQEMKDILQENDKIIIPFETPFEYVWRLNDQLSDTQRINKNAHLRTRKWNALQKKRRKLFCSLKDEDYINLDPREILIERIHKNFTEGKGGYAIPYSIFKKEEYDTSFNAFGVGKTIIANSIQILNSRKNRTLEEEDADMLLFLKSVRNKGIPADIPRFNLWKESKTTLYSMNEYDNEILTNENFCEIINKNEKFLSVFNIPTEIAYLDWSNRHALEGSADFYRSDFSFELPEMKSLYDPKIFKRKSIRCGEDPHRLILYGCQFFVSPEEHEVIKSGLRLMKFMPDFEDELDDLFILLYREGIISPSFLRRRDELLDLEEETRIKESEANKSFDDQEILLEMLKWRSEIAESTYDDSLHKLEAELAEREEKVLVESNLELQDTTQGLESLESMLFNEAELALLNSEDPPQEYEPEDDFDFSYDYDSEE